MQEHPQLVDEALADAEDYCSHLVEQVAVRSPVTLSDAESAELLIGKARLSQRAYKALKKSLKKKDIFFCGYKVTVAYIRSLNVGRVSSACAPGASCMCASSDFRETMSLVFACKELVDAMSFPTAEESGRLLQAMHQKFPSLYHESVTERLHNRRPVNIHKDGGGGQLIDLYDGRIPSADMADVTLCN